MRKVNFGTNFTTTISGYFQYDYGQIIDVYGIGTSIDNLQFEFIQDGQQITVLGTYQPLTNSYTLRIPDTFLQKSSEILTYIYYEDEVKGQTVKIIIIKITPREKYESIPDPEHHSIVEQILEELAHLQDEIDHWTLTPEQMQQIVEQVEAEIDLENYYDKQETDDLLDDKADKSEIPDMDDYYTKSETDALIPDVSGLATKTELTNGLSGKADKSDTYTKQQVDNLIPDLTNYYNKTQTDNLLNDKADKSNTYTKTEVDNLIPDLTNYYTKTQTDNLLNDKANASDVYTKTQVDNLLPDMTNYYTKSETYSKTEIDNILGNIQTILEAI